MSMPQVDFTDVTTIVDMPYAMGDVLGRCYQPMLPMLQSCLMPQAQTLPKPDVTDFTDIVLYSTLTTSLECLTHYAMFQTDVNNVVGILYALCYTPRNFTDATKVVGGKVTNFVVVEQGKVTDVTDIEGRGGRGYHEVAIFRANLTSLQSNKTFIKQCRFISIVLFVNL